MKSNPDYTGYDSELLISLMEFNLDEIYDLVQYNGDDLLAALTGTLVECKAMLKALEERLT